MSHHLADISDLVSRMPGTFYRRSVKGSKDLLLITEGCFQTTGYTVGQWLSGQVTFKDIILPEFWSHYKTIVRHGLSRNHPYSVEFKIAKDNGDVLWVWEQGHGVYEDGILVSVEGYITDISLQKEREVSLHQELLAKQQLLEEYKGVVDTSAIVSKTDANGIITYVNEQFCNVTGFSSDELVGSTHAIVRHPETPNAVFQELWQTILSGNTWKGTFRNRAKAGHDYYVSSVISPIVDAGGDIVEFISVRFDITEQINKEKQIRRQTTDQLTGLPNRQKLLEDLDALETGYLSLININDFKLVNEYHGYEVGDQLLCDMAVLLRGLVHGYGAKLYRLSGDEFAVLQCPSAETTPFNILCDEIVNKVASTYLIVMETEFALAVTLGISSGPSEELLLHADIALHSAKAQKNSIVSYDVYSPLKRQIDNNITWLKRIREAIVDDRIVVFAQPIIDVHSPDVSRYECLMRLREGDSFSSPYLFLEAAKHGRLYGDLTRIVVQKACEFFATRDDVFSINITATDILNPKTSSFIYACVREHNIGPRIIFELVETEAIEGSDLIIQFFDRIKALGCGLAIDDFGTGYSNFEYLLKLDIDYLKIDGSLIRYIDRDENAKIVAETVVDFARRLNVKTVAEFVHNGAVEQEARRIGVDFLQGFLLGEPVPLDDL